MRRTILAVLAVAGFPLLVLVLLAATLALDLQAIHDLRKGNNGLDWIASSGSVLALGFVAATIATLRNRPAGRAGIDVTAELAALIGGLAALAGTRAPDRVLLVDEVNAYVMERDRRRELHLGAQLLAGLTVSQLASVIAHELGHCAHGDTRLARWVNRTTVWIATASRGVAFTLWWPAIRGYEYLFHLATRAMRRHQERLADRLAADATGPAVAVAALGNVERVAVSWRAFDERYLTRPGRARRPVADLFMEYAAFHRDALLPPAPPAVPSRWDTHPPIQQRIESLFARPAARAAPTSDDRPAWCLVPTAGIDELLAPGQSRESLAAAAQHRRAEGLTALAAPLARAVRALSGHEKPQVKDLIAMRDDPRLAERTRQEVFNGPEAPLARRVEAALALAADPEAYLPTAGRDLLGGRAGAMAVRLNGKPCALILWDERLWFWLLAAGNAPLESLPAALAARLQAVTAGTPGGDVVPLTPSQVARAERRPGRRFAVDLTVLDGRVITIRAIRFSVFGRRQRHWSIDSRAVVETALTRLIAAGGRGEAADPFDSSALTRAELSRRATSRRNYATSAVAVLLLTALFLVAAGTSPTDLVIPLAGATVVVVGLFVIVPTVTTVFGTLRRRSPVSAAPRTDGRT